MHVAHLSLVDYRSYPTLELDLRPGTTTFVGLNGQGKTNLVEAIGYVATLGSHRVSGDAPLVRQGAERAVVRAQLERGGRRALVELEITPGKANRARLNGNPVRRTRDVLGVLRTVLFAPEDLALVKGDPGERRRYLDELLVTRWPRIAGVRADYDRILRQRTALLKSAGSAMRSGRADTHTLDVWDEHLATTGAELLSARLALLADLRSPTDSAYRAVSGGQGDLELGYRSSLPLLAEGVATTPGGEAPTRDALREALLASMLEQRKSELDRGVCLVGPHRDDLVLTLGGMPAKGYASHGESWSVALGLRLASYRLLLADDEVDDPGGPVLVLDDVFAELDAGRRERLSEVVADAEQVLVTAAVPEDVPAALRGEHTDRVHVTSGAAVRGD
ncbi:DNA replication/repair protein RecF [Kineococcus radiotolerans]|uniref:DNA replication and repair protein RecF n=1 Tax=Kineococcus radiotolerans (strain ATCC BAA-149 / DSM 14245 / SRS30216) TaxID=266940 RepID=RECF_KINRD|nr:DNA replication/repair protein RecF [Kineococcus radiotolerans]A6W3V7.1 RecName: Full=DNA replication and repair protein RecF [Kineococcus radiotolerans SRS30216 = ATCC BAA-149]ABS01496.1 DNA replication and repair protein RecF [Kineococcus radiotolerans SRS30216 = ATCC BAA-149]